MINYISDYFDIKLISNNSDNRYNSEFDLTRIESRGS